MGMERWHIYEVDFGNPIGHEQGSRRPAIVVSENHSETCIVIPLTSVMERASLPYTIQVNSTKSTNLRQNSIAIVFQIRAVSSARFGRMIGIIEEYQIKALKAMIREMLELGSS